MTKKDTLEANPSSAEVKEAPERLTPAFPTADVAIVGARLGKLVELINEHSLASVSAQDARYAGTVGRGPSFAGPRLGRDQFPQPDPVGSVPAKRYPRD